MTDKHANRKYDWEKLLDGKEHKLTAGKDFDVAAGVMRGMVLRKAWALNIECETSVKDGVVTIKAGAKKPPNPVQQAKLAAKAAKPAKAATAKKAPAKKATKAPAKKRDYKAEAAKRAAKKASATA